MFEEEGSPDPLGDVSVAKHRLAGQRIRSGRSEKCCVRPELPSDAPHRDRQPGRMSRFPGSHANIAVPELQAVMGTYCLHHLTTHDLISLRQAAR